MLGAWPDPTRKEWMPLPILVQSFIISPNYAITDISLTLPLDIETEIEAYI